MRRLLIVLLALGAIGGFGAGFARIWHYHHYGHGYYGHGWHQGDRLEQRVADICVKAAERRLNEKSGVPAPTAPQ